MKDNKKQFFKKITFLYHHELCGTIEKSIECLQKYKEKIQKEHPEYHTIETRFEHDMDGVASIVIYGRREETDEEFNVRRQKEIDKLQGMNI